MRIGPELLSSHALDQLRQAPPRPTVERTQTEAPQGPSFTKQVTEAIDHVNTLQQHADVISEQVASGNTEETHKAMVAMEHALLALDFTLQVRNKALEAYQEILKTQV